MIVGSLGYLGLMLIGFGPALWMFRPILKERDAFLVAVSPVTGLALVTVVVFPLYRYVGPASVWAWPAFGALVVLSASLCWLGRAQIRRAIMSKEAILILILAAAVICIIGLESLSAVPLRTLYGHNASDALTYLTIVDSALNVPWPVLIAGNAPDATPESAVVIQYSTTALYSARMVAKLPIRLATMIDIAWLRAISGILGHESLFPFKVMVLAISSVGFYALSRLLRVNPWVATAIGGLSVLNFWMIMALEHDSYSVAHTVPLIAFAIIGWSAALKETSWLPLLATTLAFVSIFVAYTEYIVVFVPSIFAAAILAIIVGHPAKRVTIATCGCLAGATAFAFATGQFGHHYASLANQLTFVRNAPGPIGSTLMDVSLRQSPLDAPLGTWWLGSKLVGIAGSACLLSLGLQAMKRTADPPLIGTCAVFYGAMTIAFFALTSKNDIYSALKVYSTAFPLAIVLAGLAASGIGRRCIGSALLGLCGLVVLGTQVGYAIKLFAAELRGKAPEYIRINRDGAHPLAAIVRAINVANPRSLVVYDPPDQRRWWHSAFLMLALEPYKPFYQAGFLIDNNDRRLDHPLILVPPNPDFALIATGDDYLAGHPGASLLEDFGSLRLYRLSGGALPGAAYRVRP